MSKAIRTPSITVTKAIDPAIQVGHIQRLPLAISLCLRFGLSISPQLLETPLLYHLILQFVFNFQPKDGCFQLHPKQRLKDYRYNCSNDGEDVAKKQSSFILKLK
ncbi:MAG TPA: hypothetical protein VMW45_03850 [Dehalococcoidia bacterium]|nr:hypothetical protein [Dehalococcoidia bacterium]